MSFVTRLILILAVVGAAVGVAYKFTPHHEGKDAFETLFLHLMPTPLLKDTHAAPGEEELLLGFDVEKDTGLASVPGVIQMMDVDPETSGTQLALTNLQIFQVAAVALIFVCFLGLASQIRRGGATDGLGKFFAGWAMWIRDEMVYPIMGKELGTRFLPYFLTLFFFLVFMNLLGLVPMGATATASIAVTFALAVTTFFCMLFFGMKANGVFGFWKGLIPHVPWPLYVILVPVELLGLLVKPFALMIRLFANMTGGHMVVLSFMGLIFFFARGGEAPGMGYGVAPVAIAFASFIMIIEVFVALVQAYIFTQLSILFIGASIHQDH